MRAIGAAALTLFTLVPPILTISAAAAAELNLNRIGRISHLGTLPGYDATRLLLEGVDNELAETKAGGGVVSRFKREMSEALIEYRNASASFESARTLRPAQMSKILRAAFVARKRIFQAANRALKEPVESWASYHSIVNALMQTQNFHHTVNRPLVSGLKINLSSWPTVFERTLLSATRDMQLLLVTRVIAPEFIPPHNVYGVEARRIVARAFRDGKLHPAVMRDLRRKHVASILTANEQNRLFSTLGETLSRELEIPILNQAELKLWNKEWKSVLPVGIHEYLETEIDSIGAFVEAFRRLKVSNLRDYDLRFAQALDPELRHQLELVKVNASHSLVKSYNHMLILIAGILTGKTVPGFAGHESWPSIFDSFLHAFHRQLIHPAFAEFALKLLADFLAVGRNHFPMSKAESRDLTDLFLHSSHFKTDHPRLLELSEVVMASGEFSASLQLAVLNYRLAKSDPGIDQAEMNGDLKEVLLAGFPLIERIKPSFKGSKYHWRMGEQDLGESLAAPYLEIWLHQMGVDTETAFGCEAALL